MNISAKSKYAVRALVELAHQTNGQPIPIADIANRRDIPLQFLEQLFSTLRKSGILNSHRGVRGGFSFNRLPEDITILDVVEVLDGNISPAACTSGASCERAEGCIMNEVWKEVKSSLEETLASWNIGDLAARESLLEDKSREMYYI